MPAASSSSASCFYLVVGYPSSDFTNIDQKKDYLKLITPKNESKSVEMILNEVKKKFIIEEISVYPEGIAILPRMKNCGINVHIADIGGQNINYRNYDANGNTLASFSLDKAGINHLEEYIKNQLRKFVRADIISVESINILEAIKKGHINEIDNATETRGITSSLIANYSSSEEFIEDTVLTFIENNILGQLISRGVNFYQRGNFIIFTGGGSIILKPYLEKILTNNIGNMYFSNTAQWDNCISYVTKDIGARGKKEGKMKEAQLLAQKVIKQVSIIEKSA